MTCSCCGQDCDASKITTIGGRDDVAVCRDCLEQLLARVGVSSTPTLPVLDMAEAAAFYTGLGFGVRIYDDGAGGEPGFAFVDYDGQSVFDLDLVPQIDAATNGAGCYLITREVDEWHARMAAEGVPVTPVQEQPWGMREFTLTDPNGNHLRIGRGAD